MKAEIGPGLSMVCDRCGKHVPGDFVVAKAVALYCILVELKIYYIPIEGHICPRCTLLWREVAEAFWRVDAEAEIMHKLEAGKPIQEAGDETIKLEGE